MALPDVDGLLLNLAVASHQKRAEETPAPSAAVRKILEDEDSSATGCFLAVRNVCGDACRVWEPESLWLTFDRRNVNIPAVNRDKILAAHTLTVVPAFWWEVNSFQNTVMAFNSVLSDPTVLQEATPGQLAWGIFEAEMIYGYSDFSDTPVFDREPMLYAGACLHRAGYVLTPDLLSFAQDALDEFNKGKAGLDIDKVRIAWKALQGKDLKKKSWKEDSPLDVHLSRLASVSLYIEEQAQRYQADITQLV